MYQFSYLATILRVIDGDTLQAMVPICPTITATVALRLLNINCPERETPEGQKAIEYVKALLGTLPVSVPVQVSKADKYGRWLASVSLQGGGTLEETLLQSGHAVPFMVTKEREAVVPLSGTTASSSDPSSL
jgi:endonuclease YncB( thermonuclease family)